jgi:hypothetical protein
MVMSDLAIMKARLIYRNDIHNYSIMNLLVKQIKLINREIQS